MNWFFVLSLSLINDKKNETSGLAIENNYCRPNK